MKEKNKSVFNKRGFKNGTPLHFCPGKTHEKGSFLGVILQNIYM